MAVISTILGAIGAAAAAIGSAVSAAVGAIGTAFGAISGFLGTSLGTIGGATITSGAAAGTVVGGTSITVGGVLAGVGAAAMAGISLNTMYQNARANATAQQAQIDAMKQLTSSESGQLEVNNTAKAIQENTKIKRTLSSLRVPLGITPQPNETITQNVYGVDTNTVATATQNMTGLNIAAA